MSLNTVLFLVIGRNTIGWWTVGTCGHTPSSESKFTAACRRLSLLPASTQTHISHIPQSLQAPGAASQLGATLDYSRPPEHNTQTILQTPSDGTYPAFTPASVFHIDHGEGTTVQPLSPRSTADKFRKKQKRPRTMTIHQNVNEFLKILVLSSGESINSFALLLCLKVSLTQRCGKWDHLQTQTEDPTGIQKHLNFSRVSSQRGPISLQIMRVRLLPSYQHEVTLSLLMMQ